MHTAYVVSVWLHIVAAAFWVGGMLFLVLVVVPWVRHADRRTAVGMLRDTGRRFRNLAWVSFAVLLVTGSFNLWVRGVRLEDLGRADWLSSPFGHAVVIKLAVFAVVIALSALHDFVLGPRATQAAERDPRAADTERLRRAASYVGRANLLLGLLLFFVGVTLVRGCVW